MRGDFIKTLMEDQGELNFFLWRLMYYDSKTNINLYDCDNFTCVVEGYPTILNNMIKIKAR